MLPVTTVLLVRYLLLCCDPESRSLDLNPTFQAVPDLDPAPDPNLKPGQINNWQILSVYNGTAARLLKHFFRFPKEIPCTVISQRRIGPF
jgi:hypothetical protein